MIIVNKLYLNIPMTLSHISENNSSLRTIIVSYKKSTSYCDVDENYGCTLQVVANFSSTLWNRAYSNIPYYKQRWNRINKNVCPKP